MHMRGLMSSELQVRCWIASRVDALCDRALAAPMDWIEVLT